MPIIVKVLDGRGIKRLYTQVDKPWNFVLGDGEGQEVDVHVISFDEFRNGIYGPAENGDMYPAESLTGVGVIEDHPVRCISAEWQVRFHTGYEWDDNDRRDMAEIAERFSLELPNDPIGRRWMQQEVP